MGYSTENLGSLHVTTRRILMLKDQMELEEFETAAKSSVTTFLLSLRQLHATIIRIERCLYSLIKYCRRMVLKSGGRHRLHGPGKVREATTGFSS
jgi:hypothetical protein